MNTHKIKFLREKLFLSTLKMLFLNCCIKNLIIDLIEKKKKMKPIRRDRNGEKSFLSLFHTFTAPFEICNLQNWLFALLNFL